MHSLCKEILLGKGLRQKYLKMVFLYKEISVSQHKHIIRPLWNFFFLFHLDEMIPVVLIPLKILFSKLSVFHPNRRGQEKGPHTTLKHQGKFTFTVRGGVQILLGSGTDLSWSTSCLPTEPEDRACTEPSLHVCADAVWGSTALQNIQVCRLLSFPCHIYDQMTNVSKLLKICQGYKNMKGGGRCMGK